MYPRERLIEETQSYVAKYAPNPGVKQAKLKTSKRFAEGEITNEIEGGEVVPVCHIDNSSLFEASLLVEFGNEL